jgi:uncharacterized damage-inducible protein DinB
MTQTESLLLELDAELRVTRTFLERVPMDRADWKPHDRSSTLGRLANHVADLPGFGLVVLTLPAFDPAASGVQGAPPPATDSGALLAKFDHNVERLRAALAASSDDDMAQSWRMTRGEHVIVDRPRGQVLRSFVLSHLIHHRGQLSVYLRLLGVPVPGAYGQSADER